ncbi:DoxX family protein [Streptomyces sp. NPDC037389]|uniref:DoxX family protein n=1 Tax=Streptomyces sp. NPDC037389 TaxID=3155369 RepID=UPI0033E5311E
MSPTPTAASPTAGASTSATAGSTLSARLDAARPYALSLFRVVVGLLFACHGAASLFGILGGAAGSNGGTIPAGTWPGWYAAVIQLVAGVLVLLGAGTRSAAFIASGSMAYAYFDVHQSMALWPIQNGGEASAMFAWAFLLLVFTGPGALSVDRFLGRGKRN